MQEYWKALFGPGGVGPVDWAQDTEYGETERALVPELVEWVLSPWYVAVIVNIRGVAGGV